MAAPINHLTVNLITNRIIVDPNTGCWCWKGSTNQGGYGLIKIAGQNWLAHRASWAAYHGPIPENMKIIQSCGHRRCCNPAHLLLGSYGNEIMLSSIGAGGKTGFVVGHTHSRKKRLRKLTDDDVRAIRQSNDGLMVLASKYNVSQPLISNIRNRKRKQLVPDRVERQE